MRLNRTSLVRAWFGRIASLEERLAKWQGKGTGSGTAEAEAHLVSSLFDRDDVRLCIDIGGNKGRYAKAAAALFPKAMIHVFEPASVNIAAMSDTFRGEPRVMLHQAALSDSSGTATLFSNAPGSGLASLSQRQLDHYGIVLDQTESVQTVRFADFWKNSLDQREIDLVKMDIEGHELVALQGFGEAIRHVRVVQFEFGGCNIDTRTYFRDFWAFFRQRGFRLYRLTPLGLFLIERYDERLETFTTTNYVAVAKRFDKERLARAGG